ncbi:hypothetical protein E3P89_00914 [Wallemia ichthyophaga]|uniref:Nuclear condensin complex subunit 3 C-terminal domain-containing protein n=1 Tax=Wallemia ichthyophaga TaxID=245174 RepID=A0A4T0I7Y6_WALIC|nr:hypothetical protein E3P90_01209 [Wallemia ichthyophaga]TIB16581.1 hypothetical protein E3P93_00960 [Wallemia ichthyophaga]TIB24613.1 hypothetical protein E3P89_00914 [Wallemia ichthyophaga]TIB26398.1 hypothetical protein E3P88_01078 [Wallemia ichthyophaga]
MSLDTLIDAFTDSQKSLSNHKSNQIKLRKFHLQLLRDADQSGYTAFVKAFIGSLTRIMQFPKSKSYADRVIAFATTYLSYASAKDHEERHPNGDNDDSNDDDDHLLESPSSVLSSDILRHLLKGFSAKDKYVRFRCVQISNLIISLLGAMDEDLFDSLLDSLLERMNDKETNIRQQATLALCKLQASDDDSGAIAKSLNSAITSDPTVAVRRVALINVFPTPLTIPALLTRARDIDPVTRKSVFEGSQLSDALKDVRSIRLSPRENLIRAGLGDRDPIVQKACAGLLSTWVDRADNNLQLFLEYFDVIDSRVAEDALLALFTHRPDIFHAVQLDEGAWSALTPEHALLARVYVDHCVAYEDYAKLEMLPVVTAMAFHMQSAYNAVVALAQRDDDSDEHTDRLVNANFVLGELLKLAINLDYADEMGRRKVFTLVRALLSSPTLPEQLVPIALDILAKLSASERDFLLLSVELISELRDLRIAEEDEEDEVGDGASTIATPAKPRPATARILNDAELAHNGELDLRSLAVVIGMLERVNSSLIENSALGGILPDLVIPSVKSKDAAIRERGLHALGLVCLLADTLAIGSFQMFMNQAETAPEPLNMHSLKVVIDLLMTHDVSLFADKGGLGLEYINHFLLRTLDGHTAEYQAVSCEGVSKLMLSGMITDASLLRGLLYVYFSPEVGDNQALRQCLSYFFPVYAYSSAHNQTRLAEIALIAIGDHWDRDSDEQAVVTVAQVATLLSEWTDPRHLVGITGEANSPESATNAHPHSLLQQRLAFDTLKELFEVEVKEDRKALVQFLMKLYIPGHTPLKDIWLTCKLVETVQEQRPLADALSRNALARFLTTLHKQFKALGDIDTSDVEYHEYRESLNDVYKQAGIFQVEDATPVKKAPRTKTAPTPRAASKYGDRYTPGYRKTEKQQPKRKGSQHSLSQSVKGRSKSTKKSYSSSDESEPGIISEEDSRASDSDDTASAGKGSPIAKPKYKPKPRDKGGHKKVDAPSPSKRTRNQPARSGSQSKAIDFSDSNDDEPAADDSEDEVASVL